MGERNLTYLVDHVAFGMPAFVSRIPVDLHELLQNGTIAPGALGGESCGVMVMTIHIAVMLIVGVLGSKERRAN